MPDKFSATWLSHSSMSDFLKCPQLYYLNNVYRNPKTGNKIQLMMPQLALGQVVHGVLESLLVLPAEERFGESLIGKYEQAWSMVAGEKGGFGSETQEKEMKQAGAEMLRKVMRNPGPLKNKAVKLRQELPYFWIDKEAELILCGKIDWLEYLDKTDGVHVIDFKTGKSREKQDSLQLPIYVMLASECQKRKVEKISYWYLQDKSSPEEQPMPDVDETTEKIVELGKKIKLARKLSKFDCGSGGRECRFCRPLKRISEGEGKLVGVSQYRQDMFVLNDEADGGSIIH